MRLLLPPTEKKKQRSSSHPRPPQWGWASTQPWRQRAGELLFCFVLFCFEQQPQKNLESKSGTGGRNWGHLSEVATAPLDHSSGPSEQGQSPSSSATWAWCFGRRLTQELSTEARFSSEVWEALSRAGQARFRQGAGSLCLLIAPAEMSAQPERHLVPFTPHVTLKQNISACEHLDIFMKVRIYTRIVSEYHKFFPAFSFLGKQM